MKPFSLLIKPASADCNLKCTYCFYLDHLEMYPEHKVHRMSDETLEALIASYMKTPQPIYSFGWQGGEPTLMGVDFFRKVVRLQRKYAPHNAKISNALQTNATLITEELARFFGRNNFLIGVSVDGSEGIHNQHRLNLGNQGTHSQVMEGINLLKKHGVEFNILTLVNSSNVKHGKEVYNYLKEHGFYYQQYIPCVEIDENGQPYPYSMTGKEWGQFLIEVYDEWIKEDTKKISIRGFDAILNLLIMGQRSMCTMGGNCCQYFVMEYNGDVFPCDFFVEKKRQLGNIHDQDASWANYQQSEEYKKFGELKHQWNDKCDTCPYLLYCSGDCLKHRIYNNQDPQNISWLCEGWKAFYAHSLDGFKKVAREYVKQNMPKKEQILFNEYRLKANEPCHCGSGKSYKECHGKG